MVLHKNKWDKKATRRHERKLGAKNETALKEEKEKALSRKTAIAGSSDSRSTPATQIDDSDENESEDDIDLDPAKENVKQDGASKIDDDNDHASADESTDRQNYSRRKMQSNSWRYEELEPVPGEGKVEEEPEPEPDYTDILKDKLKSIEARELVDEEDLPINMKDLLLSDSQSSKANARSGKGNVVPMARDNFKDVTENIAKQKAAENFKRRFASSGTKKHQGVNDTGDDEQDLDDIIGLSAKGPQMDSATASEPAKAPTKQYSRPITDKHSNLDQDDIWLDNMLK